MIVLQQGGVVSSHFVDSIGFVELPAFLGEESKREQGSEVIMGETVTQTYSQVGNRFATDERPTMLKSKPSLLAQLEEGKQKALRPEQPTTPKNTLWRYSTIFALEEETCSAIASDCRQ